jgi:hypothetical protein
VDYLKSSGDASCCTLSALCCALFFARCSLFAVPATCSLLGWLLSFLCLKNVANHDVFCDQSSASTSSRRRRSGPERTTAATLLPLLGAALNSANLGTRSCEHFAAVSFKKLCLFSGSQMAI